MKSKMHVKFARAPTVIIDARSKIIQKNRSKIRDAREKLAEIAKTTDARLKIMKKRKNNVFETSIVQRGRDQPRGGQPQKNKQFGLTSTSKTVRTAEKRRRSAAPPPPFIPKSLTSRGRKFPSFEDEMEVDEYMIRRTVTNDLVELPPFPRFNRSRTPERVERDSFWTSDPFDCYEVPTSRPSNVAEPINIQRKIFNVDSTHNKMPKKGILRSSRLPSPTYHRRYEPIIENSSLSHQMRTRLERGPDTYESHGILAKADSPPLTAGGYRIVVSNLHCSVSQGDIKELFEDIGELLEARLVRPGVAEVIFGNLRDADTAVDTYHNRHLDGQPMKCLLVKPRSTNRPTR